MAAPLAHCAPKIWSTKQKNGTRIRYKPCTDTPGLDIYTQTRTARAVTSNIGRTVRNVVRNQVHRTKPRLYHQDPPVRGGLLPALTAWDLKDHSREMIYFCFYLSLITNKHYEIPIMSHICWHKLNSKCS